MKKPRIAVVWFPGNNCEAETKQALDAAGACTDIVRWNQAELLADYEGFVLPGGWAYEDRIRAGAVAAKEPVVRTLKEQAWLGKPVLGICNGCQVLVEAGLVDADVALAPNINPLVAGYYCSWIRIKLTSANRTAFTIGLKKGDVLRMPVAHGEGRFVSAEEGLFASLMGEGRILFQYCDEQGNVTESFPHCPNRSALATAAVCNKAGNVMALMPHPERASFFRQDSGFTGSYDENEKTTMANRIFSSMVEHILQRQQRQ